MGRTQAIRLSDEEKRTLDTVSRMMYGESGNDVPYGRVVNRLCEGYVTRNGVQKYETRAGD